LVAFEPVADVKDRIEAWIRSRARFYAEAKKPVLEAMMGRLIPLLAHHPDFSPEAEDLQDFAKYILFYLNLVGTEQNIAHIYKYAERVKQTRDALKPDASDNLYILSDLAQSMITKYQERRNWSFQAWPDRVGLPTGLYTALPSSEAAQQIAKKQYIPDELDEKLDDLVKALDRKKKRKSTHDPSDQPSKKIKNQIKTVIREKPVPKTAAKKKSAKPKPKKKDNDGSPSVPVSERRRSGRSHLSSNYKERDDEEDDEEMWEGATGWDYVDDEEEGEESAESGGGEDDDGDEEPAQSEDDDDDEPTSRKPAPSKGKKK